MLYDKREQQCAGGAIEWQLLDGNVTIPECPHCDLRQTQIKYSQSQGYSNLNPADVAPDIEQGGFFPCHNFPPSHWIGSVLFFLAPFFSNCPCSVSSHMPETNTAHVEAAQELFCLFPHLSKDKEIPCASLALPWLLSLIPVWLSRIQRKLRFSSGMEGKAVTFPSQLFVGRL